MKYYALFKKLLNVVSNIYTLHDYRYLNYQMVIHVTPISEVRLDYLFQHSFLRQTHFSGSHSRRVPAWRWRSRGRGGDQDEAGEVASHSS